jgi:hypothetical protein
VGRSTVGLLACLLACGARTGLAASETVSETADASSGAEPNGDAATADDGSDGASSMFTDTGNAVDAASSADAGMDPCAAMGGFCTDGRSQHDCAWMLFTLCGGNPDGPGLQPFCCVL